MKKSIICLVAALGLLASCDPVQSEKDFDALNPSADALADAISFTQYSKTDSVTPQTDGNWIVYKTSPAQVVSIIGVDANGGESLLSYGKTEGSFMLSPSRGSSPEQTVIVRVVNSDGQNVDAKRTLTVAVPTELAPELLPLCSNAGKKVWKWNTNAPDGQVWGNLGDNGSGSGKDLALNGSGKWWGVTSDEEFMKQLKHTNDGKAHGDESMDATMVFSEDGYITCYDADGKEIRKGKFSVQDYDPNYEISAKKCGTLHTDKGTILFPYEINSNGNMPTDFEIAYMSPTRLVLTYPDGGKWDEAGWSEGTFWQFASAEDLAGALTDYDSSTWTWDLENGQWGNCGYDGFASGGLSSLTGNTWWVVDNGLDEQITKYGYGFADNENATMTFKKDGTFTKSSGGQGTFEFSSKNTAEIGGWDNKTWGHLSVTGDGLLFPVRINAGTTVNEYDVVYFDDNHLVLCYPNYPKGTKNGDDDAANWMEGTYWRFKKVAK